MRLKSEFDRWGVRDAEIRRFSSLATMDRLSRSLLEKHLPRGVLLARHQADSERLNYFMSPGELKRYRFAMGRLIVGKLNHISLGLLDDRPFITIAGTREGKTSKVIKPNLSFYPGSIIAYDPKGELSRSAAFRRSIGHDVYILDPYNQTGEATASFNPLDELFEDDPEIVDDVMAIVNAMVPDSRSDGGNSKHFTDSAKTLLVGLILYVLTLPKKERHLITLRELVCLSYGPLIEACRDAMERAETEASRQQRQTFFDSSSLAVNTMLSQLVMLGDRFGGVAADIGRRFLAMGPSSERSAVLSSASVATDFIQSLMLRRTLRHSDFKLAQLRSDRPTTIFIVLPVSRADQRQFRWLRLIIQMTTMVLESFGNYPKEKPPILLLLEEFATLGTMEVFEKAAAYFPGFGVRAWYILQDIAQLRRNYEAYDSILGNAGAIQLFGNGDAETIDYVAHRLGKLMTSWEQAQAFSRENDSQLILMKGRPPAAALRLSHEDVAAIEANAYDWHMRHC